MADAPTTTEEKPNPGPERTALEAAKLGNVKDKIFVITGAYSGIGVETTKALLAEGAAKVIVGGRNENLLKNFLETCRKDFNAKPEQVDGHAIDLGDLESVQKFAKYILDDSSNKDIVLINNAGVMNTPPGHTKDGFETQMGVNVIGHFLLAKLLVPITKRQVWLASLGHTMNGAGRIEIETIKKYKEGSLDGYDGWVAYQQSKLGDILLAKEFIVRYPSLEAASLHPGGIRTNLNRHTGIWATIKFIFTRAPELLRGKKGGLAMKTPEVGASTTVTVATTEELVNGAYYDDCEVGKESEAAKNMDDAKALFDYCDEVTKKYQE